MVVKKGGDKVNERLKKLRKTLDLTQEKFGAAINVKGNTVAQWESGRNAPADPMIRLVCDQYKVNEEWLRTGQGEMFIKQSRDEEMAELIGNMMSEESDSFKKRLISGLLALDDNGWTVLEQFIDSIQVKKE